MKEDYYKELGIAPGVPTMKGAYGDPENTGVGYNTVITELGDHSVPEGWIQTPKRNAEPNTVPGTPVSWNDPIKPENPDAGYGFIPSDTADVEETFFFHSDHLGSTSYITDDKGNITQYDAYLPYGELLVDEHSSSEEMPYKFNGKELDEETGLYYYGARYMQPVASIWYGVDPLTEKYPDMGAYVYCAGNPVKLVDPDGRDYDVIYDGSSITIKAVYYTDEASAESAKKAVGFWNGLNGRYTMDGLPVMFNFTVSVVPAKDIPEGVKAENIVRAKVNRAVENGETSVNSYMLIPKFDDENENGETKSGRLIRVKSKNNKSLLTGEHEIGHSVGMTHSRAGLMTAASDDRRRSEHVDKDEIKSIIKNAYEGKTAKDEEGNPVGKGHFYNKSGESNIIFNYNMEEKEIK